MPDHPLVRAVSRFRFDRGSTPPLTELGREVVRRMSRAGMIVDGAHAGRLARMLDERGVSASDVRKILMGNVIDVLKDGWSGAGS